MAVPIDKGATLDNNSLWELMNELCDVKKKWKLIGLGLRLPPSDLEAMSGDPLECLQNSLSQWLKRINPLPTWDALIAVLGSRVLGEEKKAQELEEKFCRVTHTHSDPPTHVQAQKSATMSPPRTQSGTSDGSETSPTHEVTPEDGESSERLLSKNDGSDNDSLNSSPARPSLRSSLERISDAEVKSKVTQKDTQFRTLVRKTQQHLSRSKKGDFAAFKVAITYMPASLYGHNILLSPDDRNDIMKATSFDQIFVVLNQYWTYSQYELLAYVVQEYGNDGLKEEMKKYKTDMEELEVQIGTNHFTTVELCHPRPDSIVIEVHLSSSQHKLHDARLVQLSVAEQCKLHPHTIRTFKCTPGSTGITLLIPYAVAGHVMATLYGMMPAGDLLFRPLVLEERVFCTMDVTEIGMYIQPNTVPDLSAGVPESTIITGRRERSGLSDSTATITTGYDTLCSDSEEGKEGEPHSETAMLTRVPREREKEVKEFQHNLSKLRSALHDVEEVADKDDYYFLRWLKARKFNVAKAEDMLRKHIDVRKKHKLDTILTDYKPVEVLEKYFPGGLMGEDGEGHPVWYDHFSYDFRGLFFSVRMDDIMTLFMYRAELCFQHCAEASVRKGQHIDSITFVIDFDKFSPQRQFYWPGIQMIRKVLSMFEANYPEGAHRVFLIHTHSFFRKYYNLVKGFLHENTRSKIFFLGSDYKEVLLKYISPDQLPEAYGGTICDPDPYCTKYINPGGDVPKKYYLSNLMKSSKKEMERVVVGRRSSYLISYNVDTPGSKLRWDFMTTDHGIKYGWYLKSSTGQRNIDVVPVKKAKSHVIPENGMHICESPGEYVLKFDNSHGWIRSKEVFYLVTVIPPESDATPLETKATPTQSEDSVVSTSAAPIIRDGHT